MHFLSHMGGGGGGRIYSFEVIGYSIGTTEWEGVSPSHGGDFLDFGGTIKPGFWWVIQFELT